MDRTISELFVDLGIAHNWATLLEEEEFSLDILKDITDEDLKSMGLPMGPRKKIKLWQQSLKNPVISVRAHSINNTRKTNIPRTNILRTNIPRTTIPRTTIPRTTIPRKRAHSTNMRKTNIPRKRTHSTNNTRRKPLRSLNTPLIPPPKLKVTAHEFIPSPKLKATAQSTLKVTADAYIPPPPPLYRQTTVSETLLYELIGDVGNNRLLDRLMRDLTHDIEYQGSPLILVPQFHNGHTFLSKQTLKNTDKSIYYNWADGTSQIYSQIYHLSLHNSTGVPGFENVTSRARNTIGSFHLMNDITKNIRRILINLINDVYEISICIKGTFPDPDIDIFSERIATALVEYYRNTGRRSVIIEGRC